MEISEDSFHPPARRPTPTRTGNILRNQRGEQDNALQRQRRSHFYFIPTTGTTGVNTTRGFTDSRFANFDSAGDTLSFLNFNQSTGGGMNLRNLNMTFDVTAVPEPGAALLGLIALLRRRR